MRPGTRYVAALAASALGALLLAGCGGAAAPVAPTAVATKAAIAAAATSSTTPAATPTAASTPVATAAAAATATPPPTAAPTTAPTTAPTAAPTSAPPPPPPPPGGNSARVDIVNFTFTGPATIGVGVTVTWTNNDDLEHDIAAKDASFNSEYLTKGKTYSRRFDAPGSFEYLCSIHPFMTGTVTVR